jgi:hypothetical protein
VERAADRTAGKVRRMRQLPVACLLLATAATLAACSGSGSGSGSSSSGAPTSTGTSSATASAPVPQSTVATRWWSNSAASAGSTIDPSDPTAAAGSLKPNRDEYCTMLKQTMAAGKSILPGATATDPRLITSTEAFLTELQKVAPAEVSHQWKTLSGALIQFVKTTGKSTGGVSTAEINSAAATISADAKARCHVDISASGS